MYFQTDGRRQLAWPFLSVDFILCQGLAQPWALQKNTSQDHLLGGVSVISSAAGYQTLFAKLGVFWMLHDSLGLGRILQASHLQRYLKDLCISNRLWVSHSILQHLYLKSSPRPWFCMNLLSCMLFFFLTKALLPLIKMFFTTCTHKRFS